MARGAHASPPVSSLPKVSFQKIDDDVSTQPCGVHDGQARAFGYNDFSEFQRPDSYIRHIEPLESELAKQVEYDMDEQDREWLDTLNRERRNENSTQISNELFEIVMDRLEKEWFNLTKNITKPDLALPSEDSTCAICDDSEGENSNAIVFCDGCNLAVHQDCYGVPYIPEGQWLCRKCTVSPENPVSCVLCPNEGGAFKQTVGGEWVHLLCAIWIPETRVANDVFMEPVTGIDKISKQRWKLRCEVCGLRDQGACIQCAKASCTKPFHATCARRERLLSPMKAAQGAEPVTLTCHCDKHLPKEQQDAREAALAADDAQQDSPSHNAKLAKSARAYAKTYKPGPPLVPAIVVQRIDYYIRRFKLSKRIPTLQMISRYWSLKREARRGAPLLKRLHLEPWTASAGGTAQTDEEKVMKLDQLNHLLYDLEGLKDLTFSTKKRERWKLEQARALCDVLDNSVLVHERRLRLAFERITNLDRQEVFKLPVSKAEVPDYFDIIQNPMCWMTIEGKLDNHEYWDVQTFQNDIDLVVANAILYNKAGTPFHKTALRIRTGAQPILQELQKTESTSEADPVGDLEPELELLELLLSPDAIQDDLDLILDDTPLASIFSYVLPKLKPPPPPPAPALKQPKAKRGKKAKVKPVADAAASAVPLDVYKLKTRGVAATEIAAGYHTDDAIEEEPTSEQIHDGANMATEPTDVIQEDEEPMVDTPTSVVSVSASRARRRRAPRQSRPRNESLPLVDDVDNQQSFLMFNEGWILPPEQKRRGRAPVERQSVVVTPRPRKRMRLDPGPSRLSVVSTAATENQALAGSPAPVEATKLPSPIENHIPVQDTAFTEEVPASPVRIEEDPAPVESPAPVKESPAVEAPAPTEDAIVLIEPSAPLKVSPAPVGSPASVEESPAAEVPAHIGVIHSSTNALPPVVTPVPAATPAPVKTPILEPAVAVEEPILMEAPISAEAHSLVRTAGPSLHFETPVEPDLPVEVSVPEIEMAMSAVGAPTAALVYTEVPARKSTPLAPRNETPVRKETLVSTGFHISGEIPAAKDRIPTETETRVSVEPSSSLADASMQAMISATAGVSLSDATTAPPATHFESRTTSTTVPLAAGQEPSKKHVADSREESTSSAVVLETLTAVATLGNGDENEGVMEEERTEEEIILPLPISRRRRGPPSSFIRPFSDVLPLSSHLQQTERVIEENGRKVLETLDTPELRRKRAAERKKALDMRRQPPGAADESVITAPRRLGRPPRSNFVDPTGEIGSELAATTSLSAPVRKKSKKERPSLAPEPEVVESERVLVKEGTILEPGTIVWAQARSYPWWPGVIWDKKDPLVPVIVKQEYDKALRRHGIDLHLVQFFDKSTSWNFLTNEYLRMFGEDKELDLDMIAANSKRQKVKWTVSNIAQCRASYEIAMKEMETPSDLENAMNPAPPVEEEQLLTVGL